MHATAQQGATHRLEAKTAPYGTWHTELDGSGCVVTGPERIYPSGLLYFRVLDGDYTGHYVPASTLEWVEPVPEPARWRRTLRSVASAPARALRLARTA